MKKYIFILLFILCFPLMGNAGTWISNAPNNGLYNYYNTFALQEDFITASTGSGQIGVLGMGSAGGTSLYLPSIANHPGLFRRDTSAASGTIATLILFPADSQAIDAASTHEILWILRLNTNDSNTTVRIGAANSPSANPPNNGIYLEKLDGDTNWFCVSRVGAVQTRTDSGVAVSTNFMNVMYRQVSGSAVFFINNASICSHSTTMPTGQINPFTQIVNSSAASKTLDHDYFHVIVSNLAR